MTGDDVRALRLALGLTQAELGNQIGVSRTYLGLMERGLRQVSKRTWQAVQAARPAPLQDLPASADPIARRIEAAIIEHGMLYHRDFQSDGHLFDFFIEELSLAIIIDRDGDIQAKRTRDVRDILVANGKGAAEALAILLEARPLRTLQPIRKPIV